MPSTLGDADSESLTTFDAQVLGLMGRGALGAPLEVENQTGLAAIHGLIRGRRAPATRFDTPGSTIANSVNAAGAIAGYYLDPGGVDHAFVRSADGVLSTFDAPGAGSGFGQGTDAFGINQAGEVSGYFADANNVYHGFVSAGGGAITVFDAPGAGLGTVGLGINHSGSVTGLYFDGGKGIHGFVREAHGAFTSFDAPGAAARYGMNHGFIRTHKGEFVTFDIPGAGTGYGQGTVALAINQSRQIAGSYTDASDITQGYLRPREARGN